MTEESERERERERDEETKSEKEESESEREKKGHTSLIYVSFGEERGCGDTPEDSSPSLMPEKRVR